VENRDPDTEKMIAIALGLLAGLVLGGIFGYLYSSANTGEISVNATQSLGVSDTLTKEEIKLKTEGFVNQNLLQPGITANVKNMTEIGGLYQIDLAVQAPQGTQNVLVFVSREGALLFVNSPINMTLPFPKQPAVSPPPSPETDIDMEALTDDDPWAGSRDAKVIIVEFSDFQCPFCSRALPTVRQIKETYGNSVLFVYRDFPLSSIHPQAEKAAEAAQCAYEQDKFWEYHDLLFERQSEWANVGVSKFKEYAADLGLDTDQFDGCLNSGKYANEVTSDLEAGQYLGVTGTPTFFINGKTIVGAQPFSVFQGIIDEELAKAG
jgi:protein-disulfide isomerase